MLSSTLTAACLLCQARGWHFRARRLAGRSCQLQPDGLVSGSLVQRSAIVTGLFLSFDHAGWQYCRDFPVECLNVFPQKSPLFTWQLNEVSRVVWPTDPGGLCAVLA